MKTEELKDVVTIVSGVGTLLSAIVAMVTVIQIKKQRLSSYKPELILDSFVSFIFAENFLSKDDKLNFKTAKYSENNQKELRENKKTLFIQYLLQNIGFGTAKNIEGYWNFDYKKAAKVLSKYLNDDLIIETDNEGFSIRDEIKDTWIFFSKSNLSKDTIDYILPENHGDNGKGQSLPHIITQVYVYYIALKYNLKVGVNEENIYEEFEELPKPTFKINYKDFNNKKYSKSFKLSFKYAGNNFEIPGKDKTDSGIFYIDVIEK